MPLQNIWYPSHGFQVTLAWIFDIDKDVIQINNNIKVEFLS